VHAGDEFRARAVTLVIFKEQLSGLFVQSRFGVGVDEQALDRHKDVGYAILGFPVLFERVDTDFTRGPNIRVKDLGGKPT